MDKVARIAGGRLHQYYLIRQVETLKKYPLKKPIKVQKTSRFFEKTLLNYNSLKGYHKAAILP